MNGLETIAERLHLPVVIAGISGGGKSTVAAEVEKQQDIPAVVYSGRLTTRTLRPGEIEGRDGRFGVSRDEFEGLQHDLIYQYPKYDELYGFSRSQLRECLSRGNTFVIGGEPDTSIPLKEAINAELPTEESQLPHLRAVTLYIKRPINEVLLGIVRRESGPEEKLKRIEHILKLETHEAHDVAYDVDYEVLNGKNRLKEAVAEVVDIIRSERSKQLRDLFGSSFVESAPNPRLSPIFSH